MNVENPETVVMFSLKLRRVTLRHERNCRPVLSPFQLHVRVDAVQRLHGGISLRHAALLWPEEQAVHVGELHPAATTRVRCSLRGAAAQCHALVVVVQQQPADATAREHLGGDAADASDALREVTRQR